MVDDDKEDIEIVDHTLKELPFGYNFVALTNLVELMKYMFECDYNVDIVIVDYQLGTVYGDELIRMLRQSKYEGFIVLFSDSLAADKIGMKLKEQDTRSVHIGKCEPNKLLTHIVQCYEFLDPDTPEDDY